MEKFKTKTLREAGLSFDVVESEETGKIWLTVDQIARLADKSVSTIRRYITITYNNFVSEKNLMLSKNDLLWSNMTQLDEKAIKKGYKIYSLDFVSELVKKYVPKVSEALNNIQSRIVQTNNEKSNIIIYDNGSVHLNIKFSPEEDTVWLTQEQIANLFETSRNNVSMHINNIVAEGELEFESICKDFLHVGSNNQQYHTNFYNLDLILAVGYRIKGKRAIEFRKWVSRVIKEYLIKGYAIDENRALISTENFEKLKTRLELLEYEMNQLKREIELVKKHDIHYFTAGKKYDSFNYLCSIVSEAKSKVVIIDPFFDDRGLSILSKAKNVKKIVYLSHRKLLTKIGLENFRNQYGNVEIRDLKDFHDRFIIIDDKECYFIGSSLNYAGSKSFAVIKIEDEKTIKEIIESL